jgi:predicted nuclease of predicted toxin-antitoxin system
MSNRRAQLSLLFDELLPWRVAEALRILEFRVSYVGLEEGRAPPPPRGSLDEDVLAYARRMGQMVVTSDLGMILLCCQAGQSLIWIDPRARQLRRVDTVLLVFKQFHDWQERVEDATGPICLQAMRTTTNTLDLDEAASRARNRKKKISAARKSRKRSPPLGPLLTQGDEAARG